MMLFRTSGLNFRRKRRKMKLSTAKSAAAWAVEILIVLLVAFVLVCGNESDYGGKFYGVYRIRWQSDTGKPVYL